MSAPLAQLQMVWPAHSLATPPIPRLPAGYSLRAYQPGDEPRFYAVMELAGFLGWDDEKLRPWLARILPDGWLFVIHDATQQIVATSMAVHDHKPEHPFGGEMGWVASDPAHAGRGLGLAVCAAVTARLIAGGYRAIHLYTDDFRLPAIKTYLKLGYVPFLCDATMPARWRALCDQLGWPYTPADWRVAPDVSAPDVNEPDVSAPNVSA